jgi:hypothetical protein
VNVLDGGLGINMLQFFILKKYTFFSTVIKEKSLVIKSLDPSLDPEVDTDPHWPKMLVPDPDPHCNQCGSNHCNVV